MKISLNFRYNYIHAKIFFVMINRLNKKSNRYDKSIRNSTKILSINKKKKYYLLTKLRVFITMAYLFSKYFQIIKSALLALDE